MAKNAWTSFLKAFSATESPELEPFCSGSPAAESGEEKSSSSVQEEQDPQLPCAPKPTKTFQALLRNCPFTQMGDPVGKVVVGKVYHIVDEDLYIDIGHKFPVIVKQPRGKKGRYFRGAEVRIMIKRLEMSELFLGYVQEITICEAEGTLLGRYFPSDSNKKQGK